MNTTVLQLFVYPIKSCGPVARARAAIGKRGLDGDREFMLVDPQGDFVTQRAHPHLARVLVRPTESGWEASFDNKTLSLPRAHACVTGHPLPVRVWGERVTARTVSPKADDWFSGVVGTSVRLAAFDPGESRPVDPKRAGPDDQIFFADGFPILVCTDASLNELMGRVGRPVEMLRFRPNVVLAAEVPFAEDLWESVAGDGVELGLVKPCSRCVMVDVDPTRGVRDPGVLAALSEFRRDGAKVLFGQNAVVRRTGSLSVGDVVRVRASGRLP
jgi:uncharacterized protein YcbX